jgi:capsular polysaccharide biosynthesis protein
VEASEAVRRIFWRHRWLLLILIILPAVAVVTLREHQPANYAATSTIQGQGATPDADTQVQAIQSRVSAVATAPALVRGAISQAKVNRNALQVARHEISVTPLGNSAIMVLTVTDPSSRVAVALAGALANAVVGELNQLGVQDNPVLASLNKTNAQLTARRNQLLAQLASASASNATTSVPAQTLLSQLGAAEQELAANQSEAQQVLATLTTETGASVISTPSYATGASRQVAVEGVLAALAGLVVGLLIATLREVIRPTVAQPGAGARELGAVLLGCSEALGSRIVGIDQDLPERLKLAAHRAGVLTIVLTGPGSRARLAALASRLRDELPPPERVDAGHRPAGLATDRSNGISATRPPKPLPTVVTLNDVRLGAPPPDAALVVVLPTFAPHSSLDRAADLAVTADWPILGVIGIQRRSRLSALTARPAASPDARGLDARRQETRASQLKDPETVPDVKAPDDIHRERENG